MRASTHERTIQADADEPANPICQPICRLNVKPPICSSACKCTAPAPDGNLLQPANRDALKAKCCMPNWLHVWAGEPQPIDLANPSI